MKLFNIPVLAVLAFGIVNIAEAKCGPNIGPGFSAYKAHPYKAKKAIKRHDADQPGSGADVTIAGLWRVEFLVGDIVVDEGFDLWNSDGTEILNDVTPTLAGNVCLGVWTKTAPLTYTLKHPSWIYDDAGVTVIGIVYIGEQITLDASGDSYTGVATLDAFDMDGNSLGHTDGTLVASRIKPLDPLPTPPGN